MKIVVTDNKELKTEIKQKLKENGGYCPCKIEKTPDTKCMCKEFRNMIKQSQEGECHCGLYIAKR